MSTVERVRSAPVVHGCTRDVRRGESVEPGGLRCSDPVTERDTREEHRKRIHGRALPRYTLFMRAECVPISLMSV